MGIIYAQKGIHWNMFLALEREFEIVTRYIEPCTGNDNTYSIELARLLMSASQEVDVVLKAYCEKLNGNNAAQGIETYFTSIDTNKPLFLNVEVEISHYGMRSKPFSDWSAGNPPIWWTANNKVKHHRRTHFERATLKNTYNALAALEISIIHLYQIEQRELGRDFDWIAVTKLLIPRPRLFIPNDGYYQESNDPGTF